MYILIVSGHEGTQGTRGNGLLEETITEQLSTKVVDILRAQGHNTEEADYNLYDYLQKNGVTSTITAFDYILEIHFNAGGGTGSEIFVPTGETAISVEKAIMQRLKAFYPLRGKDGVKPGDFYILNKVKKNIALLEVAFMDSKADMAVYLKNADAIAEAIAFGILDGFEIPVKKPVVVKQDKVNGPYVTPEGEKLWFRAIEGSYETRAEAQAEVDKLGKGAWLQAVYVKETK